MSKIETVSFDSWVDFKKDCVTALFGERPFFRGHFIFRGQRSATWNLKPSFDRWFRQISSDQISSGWTPDMVWTNLLESFMKEIEDNAALQSIMGDEIVITALAQHHGLPTRLLDWSDSPYIACFFAISDCLLSDDSDSHTAVWALDTTDMIWSRNMGVEIITPPTLANMRLRNQYGKFTLSKTPFETLEDYVLNAKKNDEPALIKMLLPVSECINALADLDAMGINYARLFPDLSGSALNAKMRVALANFSRPD